MCCTNKAKFRPPEGFPLEEMGFGAPELAPVRPQPYGFRPQRGNYSRQSAPRNPHPDIVTPVPYTDKGHVADCQQCTPHANSSRCGTHHWKITTHVPWSTLRGKCLSSSGPLRREPAGRLGGDSTSSRAGANDTSCLGRWPRCLLTSDR